MCNLIESLGRNEVLDAIWYSNIFGKNVEDLTIKEILGPIGDLNSVGQLILGKYRLVLIFDNQEPSLADHFSSNGELVDFIQINTDTLYPSALKKYSDYVFTLNIKTVQCNHDLHNKYLTKDYLKEGLTIYIPLIQEFMIRAITDTLKIEKQD